MKTLAISPCPNDTYAFFGWLCGHVPGPEVNVEFHDIEALNQMCFARQADICKVSFHAFLHASESYAMLPVGAALGFGCGPLLVCREEHLNAPLETLRVVSPGRWTTANLLLELWGGPRLQLSYMPFDEIMDAVSARRADAGLIIHESRFTYEQMGLVQRVDLGSWWETHAQAPIPLGGIAIKRSLGRHFALKVAKALRSSLQYADDHVRDADAFMARYAQEMDPRVMRQHVDLYVNAFTHDLGKKGVAAIEQLGRKAQAAGKLQLPLIDPLIAC